MSSSPRASPDSPIAGTQQTTTQQHWPQDPGADEELDHQSHRQRHPGLTLAVVGDGWWSQELREAARDHGVEDIVEFTGHVDDDEKARQVARAWVLALPSLKEGWGLVVMEAASRGVPTVAYAEAGGVNESNVNEVTGILVSGDEHDFTRAIDRILSDSDLRSRLGERARQRSLDFSWDASALAFESVLRQAIAQRRR